MRMPYSFSGMLVKQMPRKRSKSSLQAIEASLGGILGKRQMQTLATLGRLRKLWPRIVGQMLALHSEPASLERGNLLVEVDHPALAQQIRFLESEILAACGQRFHIHNLTRIRSRFRSGAGISTLKSPRMKRIKAPLSEKKDIAHQLRNIKNPELKRALYGAQISQIEHGQDNIHGEKNNHKKKQGA